MEAANVGNTLKSMTSGSNSEMGSLLKSGDVSKATQMACAVLSLVDQAEGKIGAKEKRSVCTKQTVRVFCSVFSKSFPVT